MTPLDYQYLAISQDQYAELQDILKNVRHFGWSEYTFPGRTSTSTVTHLLNNLDHS
jgi:hypothetical protein